MLILFSFVWQCMRNHLSGSYQSIEIDIVNQSISKLADRLDLPLGKSEPLYKLKQTDQLTWLEATLLNYEDMLIK